MNENTGQITEEQLEQVAQKVQSFGTTHEQPVQDSTPKLKKKGMGLFVILLLLVLVAGLVFFIAQMMVKANNANMKFSQEELNKETTQNVVQKEKQAAQMTDDELYNDLETDVDLSMSDLDKSIDAIENDLNQLTTE